VHFSVKSIRCSGVQNISTAAFVTYQRDALIRTTPAGEKRTFSGYGTIYVLNGNGHNIAFYSAGRAPTERGA
jgi:hypothetical protein